MNVLNSTSGIERYPRIENHTNYNPTLASVHKQLEDLSLTNPNQMKKSSPSKPEDGTAESPPHGGKKSRRGESPRSEEMFRPPWVQSDYRQDMIGFHNEICDFYTYITPQQAEVDMRNRVISDVNSVINDVCPHMKMEIFGSFRTGLYLPSSDVDAVLIGKCTDIPSLLFKLKHEFLKRNIVERETLQVLDKAFVPIIKLTHRVIPIKVDISVNQRRGLDVVEYVKGMMRKYPVLPKLIFVLKQFLVARDFNEVWYGGISSYALITMCIAFLIGNTQQRPRDDKTNVGVLLNEFFELYGINLNYKSVAVRVREGPFVMKGQLKAIHGWSMLTVEDPLQSDNDLGRSSYNVLRIKDAFQIAYHRVCSRISPSKTMSKTPNQTILQMVLNVGPEFHNKRMQKIEIWNRIKASEEISRSINNDITSINRLPYINHPTNQQVVHKSNLEKGEPAPPHTRKNHDNGSPNNHSNKRYKRRSNKHNNSWESTNSENKSPSPRSHNGSVRDFNNDSFRIKKTRSLPGDKSNRGGQYKKKNGHLGQNGHHNNNGYHGNGQQEKSRSHGNSPRGSKFNSDSDSPPGGQDQQVGPRTSPPKSR